MKEEVPALVLRPSLGDAKSTRFKDWLSPQPIRARTLSIGLEIRFRIKRLLIWWAIMSSMDSSVIKQLSG